MERKIILNLAMSLDGYIADERGGYDWITGDSNHDLDTEGKWDYDRFLDHIDLVVMGKNCYDQGFHKDFLNKVVLVATSKEIEDSGCVKFINGDICNYVLEEKKKEGKDIFLFGGGILCDTFIKANVIDEYIIGIIPVILGKGRPLFLENNPTVKLSLKEQFIEEGIVVLHYSCGLPNASEE